MDTNKILELIMAFFADPFVRALCGLVVLDFVLGVAAALRIGTFDLAKVADFYKTMVVPFVLGYLATYVATKLIFDPTVLGDWANVVGEAAVKVFWLAIVATLGNSIVGHIKELGLGEPA